MKSLKSFNAIVLLCLLVSCSMPQQQMISSRMEWRKQKVVAPIPWEGVEDEWTFFNNTGYFFSHMYDPAGYIWMLNSLGVYRLELKTKQFDYLGKPEAFSSGGNYLTLFGGELWMVSATNHVAHLSDGKWEVEEISAGYPYGLVNTGDRLWYLGVDSIQYLSDGKWQVFEFPEEYSRDYYNIAKSSDGSLWFSSYEAVLQYTGSQWIEHDNLRGLSKMAALANGELLFIYDTVILSYDRGEISPIVLPGERYRYSIRSPMLLTPEGDLWFQINMYNSEKEFPTYRMHDGIVEQLPGMAFKDPPTPDLYNPILMIPEGWVFVDKNKIYIYDGTGWEEYVYEHDFMFDMSLLNNVIGFAPDGELWFNNGSRPTRYDGKKADDPFKEDQCDHYYDIGRISDDGGSIWLGSSYDNSLCYFDLENNKKIENELPFAANGMDIASDGNVWISSKMGFIARITPYILARGDYRLVEQIKIGGDSITNILSPSRIEVDSHGVIWVYVKDFGLYRYKDDVWENYSLADLDPTAFAVDSKGVVWAGKPGKLLKHENGKWIEFPQACVCPTSLTITPDDVFWFVNGCNGVYMYREETWTQYTAADLGGFTPSRILFSPDEAVWFFSYNAWTRYKPEE